MEDGDFGLSANRLYEFTWSEFCDWYIELSKSRLIGEDEAAKRNVRAVLYHVMENVLKLLHPFMPFLTEEVYQHLPDAQGMLILAAWPELNPGYAFEADERRMEGLMDVIRTIRNLRAEMKVQPGKRTHVTLLPEAGWEDAMALAEPYLQRLAGASTVTLGQKGDVSSEKTVSAVCAAAEIRIPLGDLVDMEKEIARLEKEHATLAAEIERAEARLNNPGFVGKAPAALVEQERAKLLTNQGMLASLSQRVAELKADA